MKRDTSMKCPIETGKKMKCPIERREKKLVVTNYEYPRLPRAL